jgi:hypothetical protein
MTIKHLYPPAWPKVDFNFAATRQLDPRITFTRDSIGTYIDSHRILRYAAENEPRFDHDPETGESLGLLIEEKRTNLYANSNSVTGTAATVTLGGGSSPDGGTDAILLTANTTNGYVQANTSFGVNTVSDHTISFWYKNGTGTATSIRIEATSGGSGRGHFVFNDLNDGSNVTPQSAHTSTYGIQDFPGGWKRFYMGYNSINGTNATGTFSLRIRIFGIANTETCYLFGLQAEAGSFPTSYIPTSGTREDRSVDVASVTGTNFSSWYNQSEGTFTIDLLTPLVSVHNNDYILSTNDGSVTGENVTFRYVTTSTRWFACGSQVPASPQSKDAITGKYAMAWDSSTIGVALDGITASVASGTVLTTATTLNIFTGGAGDRPLYGTLARLSYYPRRLSDEQLQALTS